MADCVVKGQCFGACKKKALAEGKELTTHVYVDKKFEKMGKNGIPACRAKCADCGGKVYTILKKEQRAACGF